MRVTTLQAHFNPQFGVLEYIRICTYQSTLALKLKQTLLSKLSHIYSHNIVRKISVNMFRRDIRWIELHKSQILWKVDWIGNHTKQRSAIGKHEYNPVIVVYLVANTGISHYVSLYWAENILIMLYGKIKTYGVIQRASGTKFHLNWRWLCLELFVNVLQCCICI